MKRFALPCAPRGRTSVISLSTLALVGLMLTAPLSTSATAAPPSTPEQSIAATADGTVEIERDSSSQRVEFVRVTGKDADLNPGLSGRSKAAISAKAEDWLADHAALFNVRASELKLSGTTTSDQGRTLTYTQTHRGVAVFGSALKVNLDADGALTSVNGHVVPDLDLRTEPSISAAKAEAAAIAQVVADPPTGDDKTPATIKDPQAQATLVIYETGTTLGQAGIPYLAWQVEVIDGKTIREQVIVDAHQLKPLNRWSDGHTALDRKLRTVANDAGTPDDTRDDTVADIWAEGQATDGLTQTRKNLLTTTSESYWMFRNTFGRDSFDNAGQQMIVVDNRPDYCPNASWHGDFASFCPGVEADDVVAHEWGHAYTEYTSGLIYQWQPGALNESYSDVWGETIDLLNDREDEGEAALDTPRSDGTCTLSSSTTARTASVVIESPASIAGPCTGAIPAANGARLPSAPQTVQVVVGTSAGGFTEGCSALTNATQVVGKWVYLDRGNCSFATKTKNVKEAGGLGLLLGQSDASAPTRAGGDSAVPQIMIPKSNGTAIKSITAGTPIMVTIAGNAVTGANSHRWLIGEKATAMATPLRDMWNPTCHGNAAKVTDAQYECTTNDNGGVHLNSGVPNRAYSLAVDGGTFNDQTVMGLGLDKAAQIWWRAGASYLTPSSDFNDFASALTQACTTLVGEPLRELSLVPNAQGSPTSSVTSADCAEMGKVIQATELRTDPVARCGRAARFTAGEGDGCGEGTTTVSVLRQDFENGLDEWTSSVNKTYPDSTGPSSWTTTAKAANSHGSAAFVANEYGLCTAETAQTGVSSLTSPTFAVPSTRGARVSFRHTLGIEDTYDGGNVKISVNGAPFSVVPTAAYTLNAPQSVLGGQDSDNPMVGEKAWSGVEQQTLAARWGTSQIDLAAAGVSTDDSVRLRFDLGTDLCAGVYGWLVDDIAVVYCATTTSLEATPPTNWIAGTTGELTVTVSAADGSTPTGEIDVRDGSDVTLGTANLTNGTATVTLPDTLSGGRHDLAVRYLGTSAFAASTSSVPVTIAKAATRVTASAPKTWMNGVSARIPVKVNAVAGRPATGKVQLKSASGAVLSTATLAGGNAVLMTPRTLKVGSQRLTVAYLGNDFQTGSTVSFPVTVRTTSRTSLKLSTSKPRKGKSFTVYATVKASPAATGRVTFKLNGRTLGTATIKSGRARLKISSAKAKKLKVNSKKSNAITTTYSGSTVVIGSKGTIKFRARK